MSKVVEKTLNSDRLLRARDVADILNISLAMAYRLMQTGEIACIRIGSAVRVRYQDVEEFIGSNVRKQTFR